MTSNAKNGSNRVEVAYQGAEGSPYKSTDPMLVSSRTVDTMIPEDLELVNELLDEVLYGAPGRFGRTWNETHEDHVLTAMTKMWREIQDGQVDSSNRPTLSSLRAVVCIEPVDGKREHNAQLATLVTDWSCPREL